MQTPLYFLKEIDEKYLSCKEKGLSRFSDEWGLWSREINLKLRGFIKNSPDPEPYKYVFIYWTVRSQLLQIFHRKLEKLQKEKIEDLEEQILELRRLISGE